VIKNSLSHESIKIAQPPDTVGTTVEELKETPRNQNDLSQNGIKTLAIDHEKPVKVKVQKEQ
jgi:hypothetical protein